MKMRYIMQLINHKWKFNMIALYSWSWWVSWIACTIPSAKYLGKMLRNGHWWKIWMWLCWPWMRYVTLGITFAFCLLRVISLFYNNFILSNFKCRIILESDPTAISYRVALRNDDIPIGEQTVAQVCLINSCYYFSNKAIGGEQFWFS